MPDTMPDGRPWPRISIVTPSFNQGQFIEETIRSVLLQGYPNMEYIIIDGGSKDSSVEIIRKYESWLAYWVSEPDRGQADAIAKGFSKASGEILYWLNSDDIILPGAVGLAVRTLIREGCGVVYGNRLRLNEKDLFFDFDVPPSHLSRFHLFLGSWIPQETMFFRHSIYESVGGIDPNLQFALDYELILRMFLSGVKFVHTGKFMGVMRFHNSAKSSRIGVIGEWEFQELRLRYLCHGKGIVFLDAVVDPLFRRISFYIYQTWKDFWIRSKRISFIPGLGYFPDYKWLPEAI